MRVPTDPGAVDWTVTTREGSRREQSRRWPRLSVRERLEALDEMTDLAERFAAMPRRHFGDRPRER
jgi:hypothetical protein